LKVILEFGSVTFLLVSLLTAFANYKIYKKTDSSLVITLLSIVGLSIGTILILYYEATTQIEQLYFIFILYIVLTIGSWTFSKLKAKNKS